MQLSSTSSAIGLFAYHQVRPASSLYERFYNLVLNTLAELGVEPTYFGAEKDRGYKKFGGAAHRRALESRFQGTTGFSMAANPHGSNTPGYDSFCECAISFIHTSGFSHSEGGVVYMFFVINERFLPFSSECYERILFELIDIHRWDFGMGFSDAVDRHPEYHIGCLGHEKLTPEEREAGQVWYSTPPEVRLLKLRSIYPYNVINEGQLSQEVDPGLTLHEFIERDSVGTLERLPGDRLWLWRVPDPDQRRALRRQLHWKVSDWRQLRRGHVDWSQRGIVIDSATLIP